MRLVVAIHDVAPHNEWAVSRWRELVARRVAGPVSLLVVPCYAGVGWWSETSGLQWLHRQVARHDEIVAHGFSHTTVDGRDGPELARRDAVEIRQRVHASVGELARLGLPARGFISPAYVHPADATDACQRAGLSWWATRLRLEWNGGGRRLPSIGLGASTGPRRRLSPAFAISAARVAAKLDVVRLDLHPADLEYPALATAAWRALDVLVDQGRTLATHSALVNGVPGRR